MVLLLLANLSDRAVANAALCDQAAQIAARDANVPLDVLRAVSRTETGRSGKNGVAPWPWTVNMEGKGRWFETRDAARAWAFGHFKTGARSFDVGCFQINYKWHHHAFGSLDDMFDPVLNAQYAALFLEQLYGELGSWDAAVGAYHSRTAVYAKRYLARYRRIHADLPDVQSLPSRRQAFLGDRQPLFPTRAASAPVRLGSLVPQASANTPLIQRP